MGNDGKVTKKCVEMKDIVLSLLRKLYNVSSTSYKSSTDLANDSGNQYEGITHFSRA